MLNQKHHLGNPCKYGHEGVRYKSGACVRCAKERLKSDEWRAYQKSYQRGYHERKSPEQRASDKARHERWRATTTGKTLTRGYTIKRKYGLSLEEFEALTALQGNACAICGASGDAERHGILCIDHDHDTNAVRALLCDDCNVSIGRLGESSKRLEAAAAYLRKHGK